MHQRRLQAQATGGLLHCSGVRALRTDRHPVLGVLLDRPGCHPGPRVARAPHRPHAHHAEHGGEGLPTPGVLPKGSRRLDGGE